MRHKVKLSAVLAQFLAVMAAGGCAPAIAASTSSWVAQQTAYMTRVDGQYSNREYGFRLTIPAGVSAWMSSPPNPNHGVTLILGDHRTIEISASFDAAFYGSTKVLMVRRLTDAGAGLVKHFAIRLGGFAAEEAVIAGIMPEKIVVQWLPLLPENAINYSVELVTTAADEKADGEVFASVLASYRNMPPEH